jgi:hypothetical protein
VVTIKRTVLCEKCLNVYLNRNLIPGVSVMKNIFKQHFIFFFFLPVCGIALFTSLQAQTPECIFKDPLIKIDFGSSTDQSDINLSMIRRYDRSGNSCPDDGNYAFVSYAADCFSGHWHTLESDHTAGDAEGRMMIVNASYNPGPFFILNIAGLKAGATYQLANWLMNICDPGYECTSIPPLIKVSIFSGGRVLSSFTTGEIAPSPTPQWKKYVAEFTLPQDVSAITLQMEDTNPGGCGNDFALDDITLQECVFPPPIVKVPASVPKPTVPERKVQVAAPLVNATAPPPGPVQKEMPPVKKARDNETPVTIPAQKREMNKVIALPKPIAGRDNPVIKKIETQASELIIELYDNGQVDGDTVSIYHNNQLIKSRAGLSEKPLTLKINLSKEQPHHELIMVADNLGSIPPNTSLMIITAKNKRYEIFISSSEQKNAKIVIDLEE